MKTRFCLTLGVKVAEKGKGLKRSQCPSTSGDEVDGWRKRPKLDKEAACAISDGTRVNFKPLPSLSSTASSTDGDRLQSPDRRATFVPPERESLQHIDLAKVLSPKRKKRGPVRAKEMERDEGGGMRFGSQVRLRNREAGA